MYAYDDTGATTERRVSDPDADEQTQVYSRPFPRPSSVYPLARADVDASTDELPTVSTRPRRDF